MSEYFYPTIAGVFLELSQAQKAMDELQTAGISNEQIRYSVHKPQVKGLVNELISLGVTEEHAHFYQNEYEQGRIIVTVRPLDSLQEQLANEIIQQYASYNAVACFPHIISATKIPQPPVEQPEEVFPQPSREEPAVEGKLPVEAEETEAMPESIQEREIEEVPSSAVSDGAQAEEAKPPTATKKSTGAQGSRRGQGQKTGVKSPSRKPRPKK